MVKYQVFLGDFISGHKSELLKEFAEKQDAINFGISEATEYYEKNEYPKVCEYSHSIIIMTPTYYYIMIRMVI